MEIEQLPSDDDRVVRVRFAGVVYRRYPRSNDCSSRTYFRCGIADARRGYSSLHRDVWIYHRGPIPDGHEIHHASHDSGDNRIENLECITEAEHKARHADEASERGARIMREMPDDVRQRMRDRAREWHQSEEGRAWHRDHGKENWRKREAIERTCERCGNPYATKKRGNLRFCSDDCRSNQRRADGIDDVCRDCVVCGASFTVNRYARTRCCSRECGAKLRVKKQQRQCLRCDQPFEVIPSVKRRYCTLDCAYRDRKRVAAARVRTDG